MAERGAEYEVIGRSEDSNWWLMCCYEGQSVWIARELVDTDGSVDSVPVANDLNEVELVSSPSSTVQPESGVSGLGGSGLGASGFVGAGVGVLGSGVLSHAITSNPSDASLRCAVCTFTAHWPPSSPRRLAMLTI
jgi:hypothetical protein